MRKEFLMVIGLAILVSGLSSYPLRHVDPSTIRPEGLPIAGLLRAYPEISEPLVKENFKEVLDKLLETSEIKIVREILFVRERYNALLERVTRTLSVIKNNMERGEELLSKGKVEDAAKIFDESLTLLQNINATVLGIEKTSKQLAKVAGISPELVLEPIQKIKELIVNYALRIEELYVKPTLILEIPEEVLPSKYLTIKGKLLLREQPISGIPVTILSPWEEIKILTDANGEFSLKTRVPDTVEQFINVIFKTPQVGEIGSISLIKSLKVRRLPTELIVETSQLLFAGENIEIKGYVLSEGKPVAKANVLISLTLTPIGRISSMATTNREGYFNISTTIPLQTLTGPHRIFVEVYPEEPWLDSSTAELIVNIFNPIMLVMFSIIGVIITYIKVVHKYVGKKQENKMIKTKISDQKDEYVYKQDVSEGIIILLWDIINNILAKFGIRIKPSQTLREYINDVKDIFSKDFNYFKNFILLVEKKLYYDKLSQSEEKLTYDIYKRLKELLA